MNDSQKLMLFLSKIIYWGLEVKNKTANSKTNNKCEKKSQIKVIRLKTKNKIKKHLTNDKTQQWIWKQNNQSETTMTIEVFGFIWTVTCKRLYGKTMLWWNHYRRINAKNNNTWLKEIGKALCNMTHVHPCSSHYLPLVFSHSQRKEGISQSTNQCCFTHSLYSLTAAAQNMTRGDLRNLFLLPFPLLPKPLPPPRGVWRRHWRETE